jgi:phosphate starvation-inducible PhoH-like protein
LSEVTLSIIGFDPIELYGAKNVKLKIIKDAFPDVMISSRGEQLKIIGEKKQTQKVKSKIELMMRLLKTRNQLTKNQVLDLVNDQNPFDNEEEHFGSDNSNVIVFGRSGKPIKAKTRNQKKMVSDSETKDILFAIGPAGTGKTYTAVALAVRALKNKLVKKIVLTRPAVEAGENLGFLPGDLKDKIDPYLRPLYDALDDLLPLDKLNHFMTNRIIEIAPLAFMRGRTLDNAFIILDEAQNATSPQLKMFLTRLGPSAKCIITGDLSQIDLPRSQQSGLYKAIHILKHIDGISTVYLNEEDVIRHRLVKSIIKAYTKDKEAKEEFSQKEKNVKEEPQSKEEGNK